MSKGSSHLLLNSMQRTHISMLEIRLPTCCGQPVLRTCTLYLTKAAGDAAEWSAESFPYFYQVFRGDEYLRGANLICARGFAGRRVSQSSPSPFFFFFLLLPVLFMLQRACRGGGGEEEDDGGVWGQSRRWRNNGARLAGGYTVAVHVSLHILRPLSALDQGNSNNNFISVGFR